MKNNESVNNEDELEMIDLNEEFESKDSKKFSSTRKMLVKLRPLFIIFAILCFVKVGFMIYNYQVTQMPRSHVFVCDNPNAKYKTEFDLWIQEELKVTWVPSYVIIQDGYVVGTFDGGIEVGEFTDKLTMAAAFNLQFSEVPDFEIENLNGERMPASEVLGKPGLYILEVVWIDCEDCEYQDDNFTDDIYEKFTTKNIYRYYVLSDREEVSERYK